MPNSWSPEDEAVWDSLVQAGFVSPDDPLSLLSVVNGAARLERHRILRNLNSLPEPDQRALRNLTTWLMMGAPDHDSR